ncbi:MAG: alpha/beta hydrolase [Symploca sp. SIO2C1]|nr:alpha/beta hydrolase [Symploca sp. SIO2C1]
MATIDILGVPHTYNLTPSSASKSPVLVFIHGWLLSRSYWQPLIERLASDYQCLTYDLRGFGDSQIKMNQSQGKYSVLANDAPDSWSSNGKVPNIPSGSCSPNGSSVVEPLNSKVPDIEANNVAAPSYTLAAYAADLVILLQQLGIERAWLIGHSLGGSIALWGASAASEQVEGVICLNAGGGIYLKEEFERFRAAGKQLVKRRPRWLLQVPLLDLLFTRSQVASPIARRWGRQRIIDFVVADSEAALRALLDSTTEAEVHRLPQVVSQLKQPVYFIAGDQDRVMEPKYVRHLASFHQLFQGCGNNVIEIPGCGHMAMVEQPDVINTHIRQILGS